MPSYGIGLRGVKSVWLRYSTKYLFPQEMCHTESITMHMRLRGPLDYWTLLGFSSNALAMSEIGSSPRQIDIGTAYRS